MFTAICPHCGLYQTEKQVRFAGGQGIARCMACGGEYAYRALPLFIVLGASGTGKTTLALRLQREQDRIIVLDGDLLWRQEFLGEGNAAFFSVWMNLALNISQCGKPVLLTMGGKPDDFLNNPQARFFPAIHVLGLCAQEEDLAARLRARPSWRNSASEEFLESMLRYNAAVRQLAPALDTSRRDERACAQEIMDFVQQRV